MQTYTKMTKSVPPSEIWSVHSWVKLDSALRCDRSNIKLELTRYFTAFCVSLAELLLSTGWFRNSMIRYFLENLFGQGCWYPQEEFELQSLKLKVNREWDCNKKRKHSPNNLFRNVRHCLQGINHPYLLFIL